MWILEAVSTTDDSQIFIYPKSETFFITSWMMSYKDSEIISRQIRINICLMDRMSSFPVIKGLSRQGRSRATDPSYFFGFSE